jgi:hypothetical protein
MLVSSLVLAAAALSPFHDCVVTSEGAMGVHVDCHRAVLQVTDSDQTLGDPSARLDSLVASIRAGGKTIINEAPAKVNAPGKIEARTVTAEGGEYWLLAAAVRTEGNRSLVCHETAGEDQRCSALLAAAAGWKWHGGPDSEVPRKSLERTLAGRKYMPPATCAVSPGRGGAAVTCADGSSFAWFELPPDANWDTQNVLAHFARFERAREGEISCDVEGVASHCREAWDKDGSVRLMVSDPVSVRGSRVAVMCFQQGRELAEACRSSLSLH